MADYARSADDSWWLMFFYAISFGGFVGLSSFLPIYFHDQFGFSAVQAGYYTAACVFAGSFARPLGGLVADRIGGTRSLSFVYLVVAGVLFTVAGGALTAPAALGIIIIGMSALGMGNGAVFQLVPQRFGKDVGLMTGLVGMTGGIGGFYLAASLVTDHGSYASALSFAGRRWRLGRINAVRLLARETSGLVAHLGARQNMIADLAIVVVGNGMAGCARRG